MNGKWLLLELFSRKQLDHRTAAETLTFVLNYRDGIFRPQECGVYEPFETFATSALDRYISWLVNAGGTFGFRRDTGPLAMEGSIANLLLPKVLVSEDSPEIKPMPNMVSPVFCTRWRLRMAPEIIALHGPNFLKQALLDCCQVADADYSFVACDEDHRAKHYQSVQKDNSVIQQYIGDNPEQGLPGLYWINFFGSMYIAYFGEEKVAALAEHAEMDFVAGCVCLRF